MSPTLENVPKITLGVVGVSRDCFPVSLTRARLDALGKELAKAGVAAHVSGVVIETEADIPAALKDLADNGANALFVYLGNFGPETPTTILMQRFPGPCMVAGAAEETRANLADQRGDALCGMLSNSFNLHMRGVRAHIPQYPIGLPAELAACAAHFVAVARVVAGVRNLKIFVFGPRPQDFVTCAAPLRPLYNLGVEVMENSELDLLREFRATEEESEAIAAVVKDMEAEFGGQAPYPDLLPRLARYVVALLRFKDRHLGVSSHAVFANKCWPAFGPEFEFQPCYVNAHMAARGYPVACEVDIYGALSEYMAMCASNSPVTILDINNSVPDGMLASDADLKGAETRDLFMGFHCGNTCASRLKDGVLRYNHMQQRAIGGEPTITRGTIEGRIAPGEITYFRVQAAHGGDMLMAYSAEGEVLDIDPATFGGTGIFAVPDFARFYRHVLLRRGFPHHSAVAFAKVGEILSDALELLGVDDAAVPLPACVPYPGENPYAWAKSARR